ncbi:MAG: efflux RND transporter periplasmic adaptor subunit [Planctomycetota bacterium]
MSTDTPIVRSRAGRPGSWVILLLVAGGCLYAGMRWHETLERWLVPSTVAGRPAAVAGESPERKQLWTCGMHPQVIQDHPGDCPICHMKLTPMVGDGASKSPGDSGVVVIDPAIVQRMGVRVAEVTQGPLAQTLRAFARITEAESAHRDVNLRVSGWIQNLHANTDGMSVRKGEALFDLYSPELRLAIEELISAHRSAKTIASDTNSSLRETSESLVAAAESRLLALDLSPEQVKEFGSMERAPLVVSIVSPVDGHITEKAGVYTGSSVTAGQRVLRIAQRTTMWVEGRVPEGDLGRVRIGQKMRARVDAYPGRAFEGEVIFIHPHLDEMTRTALVRMQLANHDGALHEGMYANLDIEVGSGELAVLVPREAIIDSGESQVVFVSAGKGRYEPRRVVMGLGGEKGLVQVLSGLKAGEQVVASGQFLVDSESRLREAIAKFLDQSPAAAVPAGGAKSSSDVKVLRISVSPAKVDAVVAGYLALAEALGATQKEDSPLKVEELVASIHALHAEVTVPEGVRLITSAASAAEAMKGQSLDRQRELFKALSALVIDLVEAMPPSPAIVASLYVVNCPMAKGDWLQRTREVANPYYAQEMKECGSVVRSVGAKGGK